MSKEEIEELQKKCEKICKEVKEQLKEKYIKLQGEVEAQLLALRTLVFLVHIDKINNNGLDVHCECAFSANNVLEKECEWVIDYIVKYSEYQIDENWIGKIKKEER